MVKFFLLYDFTGRRGGSPPELLAHKANEYDRICVFLKARKPQWIVHSIVPYHDTLCGKAGLEKHCRKAEQHENKTA